MTQRTDLDISTRGSSRAATSGAEGAFSSPVVTPYLGKVRALVSPDRFDHIRRVTVLALQIATSNGFTPEDQDRVLLAARWGVRDPVVLGAIEGHVFGVRAGDAVGAAVYVADVSEPGRGVNDDVRALAMSDLWAAYAQAVRSKVEYLQREGKEIHPATLRAYESLT